MKALPSSFGLPADVDSLIDALNAADGEVLRDAALKRIEDLRQYLGWLRTAPMPQDESVVASCLIEACDGALSVLASASRVEI